MTWGPERILKFCMKQDYARKVNILPDKRTAKALISLRGSAQSGLRLSCSHATQSDFLAIEAHIILTFYPLSWSVFFFRLQSMPFDLICLKHKQRYYLTTVLVFSQQFSVRYFNNPSLALLLVVMVTSCLLYYNKRIFRTVMEVGKVSTNFAAAKNGKVGSNFSAAKNGQVSSSSKKR